MKTRTLSDLVSAAEKINAFARKFTLEGNRRGEDSLHLASVCACVMDDNGGPLTAEDTPEGEARLVVDIEHFSEGVRTYTAKGRAELAAAEDAEDQVAKYCRELGFAVERERNTGSGQYGPINQLSLK